MVTLRFSVVLILAIALSGATAQQVSTQKAPAEATKPEAPSSTVLQHLLDEDQTARQKWDGSKTEGVKLYRDDAGRRTAVRKLLEQGDLHSGQDFENAAFIFQHGDTADDYLLAHTLATIAVAKGNASALWIAAATLDRYLAKIGQSQIYGTQFNPTPDGSWTQEPYNRTLVPEKLLPALGVPSRAQQQGQLEKYKHGQQVSRNPEAGTFQMGNLDGLAVVARGPPRTVNAISGRRYPKRSVRSRCIAG